MSSSKSASNDNNGQPQPAPKKIKANNFYCFINNGGGNHMTNIPLPPNPAFIFSSPSTSQPTAGNMPRPAAPPELQRQMSLYNQLMLAQLAQYQQQQGVQPGHQPFLPHAIPLKQHQQPVQQLQPQVSQGENLKILNTDVSSGGGVINVGRGANTVMDSMDIETSFGNFPYYLSETIKYQLVASYFLHMRNKTQKSKPKVQRTGHRVLLSGPEGSDIYQETLAMALSHHFGTKLLVFDCQSNLSDLAAFGKSNSSDALRFEPKQLTRSMVMPSFSNGASVSAPKRTLFPFYEKSKNQMPKIGDRVIYTGLKNIVGSNMASRGPTFGNRGKVLTFVKKSKKVGVRFDMPIPEGIDLEGLCEAHQGFFVDANELCIDVDDQFKPLLIPFQGFCAESKSIVFIKNAVNCMVENGEASLGIVALVNRLPDNIFVIGSHIQKDFKGNFDGRREKEQRFQHASTTLSNNFSEKISVQMPEGKKLFDKLKNQLDRDAELRKVRENISRIHQALVQHDLECEGIERLYVKDQRFTDEDAEKVVKWALGREIMARPLIYSCLKFVLSQESILYGLGNLRASQTNQNNSGTFPKDIAPENEYEKRVLEDVILHNEIGVKFDDIGALDNIKDFLKEIVILPLQRPELFCKGQLRKPCRGILLFGLPGTGKTMLAKAVATEAGANFFNISLSSIVSKWFGDSEKFVKAIFSLARKLAPSVLFIDEVDSIFGKRKESEHELTRKIKNEFMANWDGLLTKDTERVLVLAATNRPFDLDEAAIRRMPRRFMVNLPDITNRSKILKVILAKEDVSDDVDFNAIARMTDGFSGSDLKNLCVTAAYCPVRELVKKDKGKSPEGKQAEIRPLNMQDFKHACDEVRASVSSRSRRVVELVQWNELYGDGGSRAIAPPSPTPSYFI